MQHLSAGFIRKNTWVEQVNASHLFHDSDYKNFRAMKYSSNSLGKFSSMNRVFIRGKFDLYSIRLTIVFPSEWPWSWPPRTMNLYKMAKRTLVRESRYLSITVTVPFTYLRTPDDTPVATVANAIVALFSSFFLLIYIFFFPGGSW